jgi:uncharacterized protein YbjT (DUF2867 family)
VTRLPGAGHDVRSLSRHRPTTPTAVGVNHVVGDVVSGDGLTEACAGIDTIIHTATSPRASGKAEVIGAANVARAAAHVGAHLIYISIVGVDAMRYSYYRGKWRAEQAIEASGAPCTVQRATQFHDLLHRFLGWRLFPVTKHFAFQPVDTGEVADRLVGLVDQGPSGRVEDFGGPAVVPLRELVAVRRKITGSAATLVPVPPVGFLGDFDRGRHLCPDHARGTLNWEQWLTNRAAAHS